MNKELVNSLNKESLSIELEENDKPECGNRVFEEVVQQPKATSLEQKTKGFKQNPFAPSPRGYKFFELLSALQKDIRRGNEKQALRWAIEIEQYFSEKALWNRLRIIASEDIGLANSTAPLIIQTLEKDYFDLKKANNKNKPERLPLVNAVAFLSNSLKSRLVDNLLIVVYGERDFENWNPPIPDYALDKHTLSGKQQGKTGQEGIEYFFEEGTKLNREVIVDPYKEEAQAILMQDNKSTKLVGMQ
jgi:replication-associated recombination protein RarA